MKVAEVQKLEVGTKVYRVEFDVCAMSGAIRAEVIECEVIECEVRTDRFGGTHKFPAVPVPRSPHPWQAVNPKFCFLSRADAQTVLAEAVRQLKDKLDKLAATLRK